MGTISLKNARKAFGDVVIIPGASLDIKNGEFVVFVGPSGCGKSTLLRMIAGLEDLTSGAILIDGKDMTEEAPSKRGLSMVFQSYALYPHMSVRGNISFGLKEHAIFPEISNERSEVTKGMDITIVTTAKTAAEAQALLAGFNMPFLSTEINDQQ